MRFVQLLLTDDQAELTAAALRDAEQQLKETVIPDGAEVDEEGIAEDIAQLGRLSMLFQDASENPAKYVPTGEHAATVRSIVQRLKGTAAPASRRKRRADRHQRRRALRHETRRNREYIEMYNKGVERMEADRLEHEAAQAELAASIEGQPTFTVTDGYGNVLMSEIPAQFILGADGEPLEYARVPGSTTAIHVPLGTSLVVPDDRDISDRP